MVSPSHRTTREIREAVEQLSTADALRLRSAAKFLTAGLGESRRGESWEDLLQEAILRSLVGDRKWPYHLDFRTFLIGAMRSIASSWAKRTPLERVSEFESFSNADSIINSVATNALVDAVTKQLGDDEIAVRILDSMMTGMNGRQIIEHLGLTALQYQSAAKRIRRKAMKLLDDFPTP